MRPSASFFCDFIAPYVSQYTLSNISGTVLDPLVSSTSFAFTDLRVVPPCFSLRCSHQRHKNKAQSRPLRLPFVTNSRLLQGLKSLPLLNAFIRVGLVSIGRHHHSLRRGLRVEPIFTARCFCRQQNKKLVQVLVDNSDIASNDTIDIETGGTASSRIETGLLSKKKLCWKLLTNLKLLLTMESCKGYVVLRFWGYI